MTTLSGRFTSGADSDTQILDLNKLFPPLRTCINDVYLLYLSESREGWRLTVMCARTI